jgi:hypothetical protein
MLAIQIFLLENGMAAGNIGKESKIKGKTLTQEHKNKISAGNLGKIKFFSEEHKKKLSMAQKRRFEKGHPSKGKTYEQIMGVEKANELKREQSITRKGRMVSEETKNKISNYHKNKNNGISDC